MGRAAARKAAPVHDNPTYAGGQMYEIQSGGEDKAKHTHDFILWHITK